MEVYTAQELKNADERTVQHGGVSAIQLMENAARAFVRVFLNMDFPVRKVVVFCGKGNNGGDGLAIARILHQLGWRVSVVIVHYTSKASTDFMINRERLQSLAISVQDLSVEDPSMHISEDAIVIDAIFGVGLNKPLPTWVNKIIEGLNTCKNPCLAVDIPSGVFADFPSHTTGGLQCDATIGFHAYKWAYLAAETRPFVGKVYVASIGILPASVPQKKPIIVDEHFAASCYKPLPINVHKWQLGGVGVVAGAKNCMGAAILTTKAALKSGAGVVVANVIREAFGTFNQSVPEAMLSDGGPGPCVSTLNLPPKLNVVAIGPGLGLTDSTTQVVHAVLQNQDLSAVLDADALTLLVRHPEWLPMLAHRTVLTPHLGEWKRFGKWQGTYRENVQELQDFATEFQLVVVLKGPHTLVATPQGDLYVNASGNSGLATAGSGDVLTGIIAGFMAQGYSLSDAAILGVYIHGLSAETYAELQEPRSLMAHDIIQYMGKAMCQVARP